MDHPCGSKLYQFDMLLMERLLTSGLPMSQIDVQRQMCPTISSLIRYVSQRFRDLAQLSKNEQEHALRGPARPQNCEILPRCSGYGEKPLLYHPQQ